jgi:hypothetical protein
MTKKLPIPTDKQFRLFNDPDLTVVGIETTQYAKGDNLAVLAIFANGERQTVSVNIPQHAHRLGKDEFFAKHWTENEDLYRLLVANGILVPTGGSAPTGFVNAPICRLGDF